MSKEAFASAIINKIKAASGTDGGSYNSSTPYSCQQAIAEGITEYLLDNTKVKIQYNGILTAGGPDPIREDTFNLQGECASLGVPDNFSSWVSSIQSGIAAGFSTEPDGENGVMVTLQPFNPITGALVISQDALKNAHQNSHNDPTEDVWEVVCEQIMNWINSDMALNEAMKGVPASIPGVSFGTCDLVSISIT